MRQNHNLSWPRATGVEQIACPCCDALQNAPRLREGYAACCGLCGEVLFQNRRSSLSRATSWSGAALILMVLVHSFPFLIMRSAGIRTELTLLQAAAELSRQSELPLAIALIVFTIVAPLGLAVSLLYVAAPLMSGRALPGSVMLTRWIQFFQPWSMLEVFLLGLIVSLLKLGHLAELEFTTGLWALAGLVICLAAALSGIDRRELWDRLEVANQRLS